MAAKKKGRRPSKAEDPPQVEQPGISVDSRVLQQVLGQQLSEAIEQLTGWRAAALTEQARAIVLEARVAELEEKLAEYEPPEEEESGAEADSTEGE